MSRMRLFTLFLALSVMLVSLAGTAAAAPARTIVLQLGRYQATVDGKRVRLEVPAQTIDGRTMLPLRFVAEALGAEIEWDGAEQRITLQLGRQTVVLWVDQLRALINDETEVIMDAAPTMVDGRTLVPVRFLTEQFGGEVKWDGATGTITLIIPVAAPAPAPSPVPPPAPTPAPAPPAGPGTWDWTGWTLVENAGGTARFQRPDGWNAGAATEDWELNFEAHSQSGQMTGFVHLFHPYNPERETAAEFSTFAQEVTTMLAQDFLTDQGWQVTGIDPVEVKGATTAWQIRAEADDPAVRILLVTGYFEDASQQRMIILDVAALADQAAVVEQVAASLDLSDPWDGWAAAQNKDRTVYFMRPEVWAPQASDASWELAFEARDAAGSVTGFARLSHPYNPEMESLTQFKQLVGLVAQEFARTEFRDLDWQVTEMGEVSLEGADVAWRIRGTSDDPAVRTMLILGYYHSAADQAVLVLDTAVLSENAEWVQKLVDSFGMTGQ